MQAGFATIKRVKWLDEGVRFAMVTGDDTVEVRDVVKNTKWTFQRPKGTPVDGFNSEILSFKTNILAILTGDGVVRFWKLW